MLYDYHADMTSVQNERVRNEIVLYAEWYYAQHKSAASVRIITKKFKLSKAGFYGLFPKGMAELCRQAGIPVESIADRLEHTAGAQKARERMVHSDIPVAGAMATTRLLLSEPLSRRVYVLSHLELGKDPLLLLKEILDRDGTVRKLLEEPKAMANMARFVKEGVKRGWQIPWLLETTTLLYNGHVTRLSAEELHSLVGMVAELSKQGLDLKKFVQEAMDADSLVYAWKQYRQGRISADEALRRLS